MKAVRLSGVRVLLTAVALAVTSHALGAQTQKMPSMLRYGSGYLDVPVASVLSHLSVAGTFSGFRVNVEQTGFTPALTDWFWDGSAALGLFDRVELGTSLQSFSDPSAGGDVWGAFGRVALLRPREQGLGLAGGFHWLSAPTFGDPLRNHQPTRLGYPDRRFYEENSDVQTQLTLYGVASLFLRGLDAPFLPDYDVTLSAGYGNGTFLEGQRLDFYRYAASSGWFFAGAAHFDVAERATLHVLGEWNGFDANVGAQLDLGGVRIGGHLLGANYWTDAGVYRSPKLGFLVSACLDFSGGGSWRCRPELLPRIPPQLLMLPAPPPDTVVVSREVRVPVQPTPPSGTPASLCLATGESVTLLITTRGDTLVGSARVSLHELGSGIGFAGSYAEGRDWFVSGGPVSLEAGRAYTRSGGEVRLECASIVKVGEHMGVPLFALRAAAPSRDLLYVPVRPGVWQAFRFGAQGP